MVSYVVVRNYTAVKKARVRNLILLLFLNRQRYGVISLCFKPKKRIVTIFFNNPLHDDDLFCIFRPFKNQQQKLYAMKTSSKLTILKGVLLFFALLFMQPIAELSAQKELFTGNLSIENKIFDDRTPSNNLLPTGNDTSFSIAEKIPVDDSSWPKLPEIDFSTTHVSSVQYPFPQITYETFYVYNTGVGVLDFDIEIVFLFMTDNECDGDREELWISVEPESGSINAGDSLAIEVTFNTFLPPIYFLYSAMLYFHSNAPGSPHYVFASVTKGIPPLINISPGILSEEHHPPYNITSQTITLTNIAGYDYEFSLSFLNDTLLESYPNQSDDRSKNAVSWLSAEPASGTLIYEDPFPVTVTYNSSGLGPDFYEALLKITLTVNKDVHMIPVSLLVNDTCALPPAANFMCSYSDLNTVELSWEAPERVLRWDNGYNQTGLGMVGGGTFTAAARWDNIQLIPYQNWMLNHISFYPTIDDATFTLKTWIGETLMISQPVDTFISDAWNKIELDTPVIIDQAEDLKIGFEVTHPPDTGPLGVDAGPAKSGYGDLYNDGTLTGLGLDHNWNLAGYITSAFTESNTDFTTPKNNTTTLTGYNVYRNQELIATLPASTTNFTDNDAPTDAPQYTIGSIFGQCESITTSCNPLPLAWIEIYPDDFLLAISYGNTITETLIISNTGHPTAVMNYQVEIQYVTPQEDWLSITPASGQINGYGSDTLVMTIDGNVIPIGEHIANLIITSNAHNLQTMEVPVILDLITGISHIQQTTTQIYPNPTSGILTIEGNPIHSIISIFNVQGMEVYRSEQALPAVIDLTEQPKGVYLIRVENDIEILFEKIIIK